MTDRILQGSDSFLVRTLTEVAAPILSESGKLEAFITTFKAVAGSQPEVKKNPRWHRHIAEIVEKLEKEAFRSIIATAAADPDYSVIVTPALVPPPVVAENYDDVFDLVDPAVQEVSLGDTIDDALDGGGKTSAKNEFALETYMAEYVKARKHPFVHAFWMGDRGTTKGYAVVGTCVGKSKKNPNATFNANCTTGNHRKIKDVPEDILVHRNGRPVTLCHETPEGDRYFLWLLHHKPGLELRFWINVNEPGKSRGDIESGNFRIRLTNEGQGWKRA
jgi:hypothetical protein